MLAARDVDADDGDVGGPAELLLDGGGERDRVAGVRERDRVGQAGVAQQLPLRARPARRRRCGRAPRRRAAASDSEPLLPAPPTTATDGAAA